MKPNPDKVKAWQRFLSKEGLYLSDIDGDFGPLTQNATLVWAEKSWHIPTPEPPVVVAPPAGAPVDARSEGIIKTLHPMVQQPFRDLLNAINAAVAHLGVTGRWIQGYRNKEQQNAEVAAGFSHAPWPYSAHNGGGGTVGFACDLGWFDANGRYVEKEAATAIAVQIDRQMGFNPGADFGDFDHHCLRPPSLRKFTETEFIKTLVNRHNNDIPLWP